MLLGPRILSVREHRVVLGTLVLGICVQLVSRDPSSMLLSYHYLW